MNTDTQVRILEIELAKARAEATALRKALGENHRHHKRIEKAHEDALLLVFWRSVGIKPSRRFAARYEITQDRWQNALALLRMARLVEGRSRWPSVDMDTSERRLALARDKALANPELFFCAIPDTGCGEGAEHQTWLDCTESTTPTHEYKRKTG